MDQHSFNFRLFVVTIDSAHLAQKSFSKSALTGMLATASLDTRDVLNEKADSILHGFKL